MQMRKRVLADCVSNRRARVLYCKTMQTPYSTPFKNRRGAFDGLYPPKRVPVGFILVPKKLVLRIPNCAQLHVLVHMV